MILGSGKASHLSYGNDETLCGKWRNLCYVDAEETFDLSPCRSCYSKSEREALAADSATLFDSTTEDNKGEGNIMSETTTTEIPGGEEFASLVERIKVKAIAGEDTAELADEAEKVASAWKGADGAETTKGRKAMRAAYRDAAATPQAVSGAVVLAGEPGGSLETANDTADYTSDPVVVDLRDRIAEKYVGGIRAQIKVGKFARETARLFIDARSRIIYKGKPDLKAEGDAARQLSADMAQAVRDALPELTKDEQDKHAAAFLKSIRNVMQDEVIKWTRTLTADSEEAARFAAIIEPAREEYTAKREALALEAGSADADADAETESDADADAETGTPEPEPFDIGKAIREAYGWPDVSTLEVRGGKADAGALVDFNELKKIKNSAKKVANAPAGFEDDELRTLYTELFTADAELARKVLAVRQEMMARGVEIPQL